MMPVLTQEDECLTSTGGQIGVLTAVGVDGSDGSHGMREVRTVGPFTRRTLAGVDGSDASHGMCEMRPAGTFTRRTLAGVDGSDACHGMCEARTAGTFTCLTLCSGATHISDEAPLLKKLSCMGVLQVIACIVRHVVAGRSELHLFKSRPAAPSEPDPPLTVCRRKGHKYSNTAKFMQDHLWQTPS